MLKHTRPCLLATALAIPALAQADFQCHWAEAAAGTVFECTDLKNEGHLIDLVVVPDKVIDVAKLRRLCAADPEIDETCPGNAPADESSGSGDLGVTVDFGRMRPGDILQRFDNGRWTDYRPAGEPVTFPFDLEALEPGEYRLRPAEGDSGPAG